MTESDLIIITILFNITIIFIYMLKINNLKSFRKVPSYNFDMTRFR